MTLGNQIWVRVGGPRAGLDTVDPVFSGYLFSLFAGIESGVVPLVRDRAADAIHCLEQDI